jgi:hypothetical protein
MTAWGSLSFDSTMSASGPLCLVTPVVADDSELTAYTKRQSG